MTNKKQKSDPHAKRPHETDLQWKLRVARMELEKRRGEALQEPTAETMRHGVYRSGFVLHLESRTKAKALRNQRGISSLVRMHAAGQLTNDQFVAAQRIARIAERIEGDVALRCASLEARVDNSGRSTAILTERIAMVRDELAYTEWRGKLRLPRRMVIDMLLLPQSLKATACAHHMHWRRAKVRLLDALDSFIDIRDRIGRQIDEDDMLRAHRRAAA